MPESEPVSLSVCCGAPLRQHEGEEGTQWYTCSKCKRPADAASLLTLDPPPPTPEQIEVIKSYLRPDRALSPKSAEAIDEVLSAAAEQLANQKHWWVRATVSGYIVADSQGDAMQEMCDRLSRERPECGAPFDYEINDIDAREST